MKFKGVISLSFILTILLITGCSNAKEPTEVAEHEETSEELIEINPEPEVEIKEETDLSLPATCGNNKCEPEERCDESKHSTICRIDCNLQCEAFLSFHEENKEQEEENFNCFEALNCDEISSNKFVIKGDTRLVIKVENVGEKISSEVSSDFHCTRDNTQVATNDNDGYKGIIFSDSFEGKEKIALGGKYKEDNKIDYEFSIDYGELESPFKVECAITLSSAKHGSKVEFIDLTIR